MIIYNITVNISNDLKDDWLNWMTTIHLPEVVNTGCFTEYNIFKVLVEEDEGVTYSVQLTCNTMQDYDTYKNNHAHKMQKIDGAKYANKLAAFSTLLQKV